MKQNSNKNRSNARYGRFNNRGSHNAVNRNTVFDSSSPAGRVRGTSQQLVEKYMSLAKDAKNQDDRVLYETYLQYADHYGRMLAMAIANEQPKQPIHSNNQEPVSVVTSGEENTASVEEKVETSENSENDTLNEAEKSTPENLEEKETEKEEASIKVKKVRRAHPRKKNVKTDENVVKNEESKEDIETPKVAD